MPSLDSGPSTELPVATEAIPTPPGLANKEGLGQAALAETGLEAVSDPKTAPMGSLGQTDMAAGAALPAGVSQQTGVVGLGSGGGHQIQGDFAAPKPAAGGPKPVEAHEQGLLAEKPSAKIEASPAMEGPKPAENAKTRAHEDPAVPGPAHAHVAPKPAPTHQQHVAKDGPGHSLSRAPKLDGPERKVEVEAPTKDSATKDAIKEAKHDGSILGPLKQHILDNPLMVAGAIGAAVAAMGGGWKWSLLAMGAAYLGTTGFAKFSDTSKKADGFDKIAKLHGEAGPKKG